MVLDFGVLDLGGFEFGGFGFGVLWISKIPLNLGVF